MLCYLLGDLCGVFKFCCCFDFVLCCLFGVCVFGLALCGLDFDCFVLWLLVCFLFVSLLIICFACWFLDLLWLMLVFDLFVGWVVIVGLYCLMFSCFDCYGWVLFWLCYLLFARFSGCLLWVWLKLFVCGFYSCLIDLFCVGWFELLMVLVCWLFVGRFDLLFCGVGFCCVC